VLCRRGRSQALLIFENAQGSVTVSADETAPTTRAPNTEYPPQPNCLPRGGTVGGGRVLYFRMGRAAFGAGPPENTSGRASRDLPLAARINPWLISQPRRRHRGFSRRHRFPSRKKLLERVGLARKIDVDQWEVNEAVLRRPLAFNAARMGLSTMIVIREWRACAWGTHRASVARNHSVTSA